MVTRRAPDLETTLPGSDLSFYKIDYRGQVFAPLTDNYTMRFHTELGYGDGYGPLSACRSTRTTTPAASTRCGASRTARWGQQHAISCA